MRLLSNLQKNKSAPSSSTTMFHHGAKVHNSTPCKYGYFKQCHIFVLQYGYA